MSNSKISALTSATTPLAGTEILPIVQSSTTKQVSVADLTVGRAIIATSVTASTGNFVVGTSGQGVDFSATPGTGTSELFADYEEGTWTPSFAAWTTAPSTVYSAKYTKVGRVVTVIITAAQGVCSVGQVISGLPFTVTGDGTATMKDISGSTAYSIAVSRDGSTQIQSPLAVSFTGLNWVLSSTYFA
jgi:hypothetical protein